jgi:nucleoside-diphosphate-sugar epimerase
MKVFITGGTGFVGSRLTEKLLSLGYELVILIRNPAKALYHNNDKVTYVVGDILEKKILEEGTKGCDWVFHMAAFTEPWSKDPEIPRRINVTGTVNVIEAAIKNNVKRVIITSTAGTMGYSINGHIVDENTGSQHNLKTLYEKSKAEAEMTVLNYSNTNTKIIITNPARIYGPGKLSKSNSLTKIIKWYISGLWRILPDRGNPVGNYVYIDDVVNGHILTALHGKNGQRYILGGENLSFRDFFNKIGEISGRKRKLLSISFDTAGFLLKLAILISKVSGTAPVITQDWINKYRNDAILTSEKAITELGYSITPFEEGISETIKWLRNKNGQETFCSSHGCKPRHRESNCV